MNHDPCDERPLQVAAGDGPGDESDVNAARCFAQLAGSIAPAVMSGETQERLWLRVRERIAAAEPEGTTTVRADGAEWIALNPLVRFRRLRVDVEAGYQTILVKADPGGCLPRHRHSKDEEFIVLEGECHIGSHHLRAGDAHFASAGSWHEDLTTRTGVLVLVRGEYAAATRA